jgi:hypothetical protein
VPARRQIAKKRPFDQRLAETTALGALQGMQRTLTNSMMKSASLLQQALDKSGGGPGLGGYVAFAVHKKKLKLKGNKLAQTDSKSSGMPFDKEGIYMFGKTNTEPADAFKPLAKMALKIQAGGKVGASTKDKARYTTFMRDGASS